MGKEAIPGALSRVLAELLAGKIPSASVLPESQQALLPSLQALVQSGWRPKSAQLDPEHLALRVGVLNTPAVSGPRYERMEGIIRGAQNGDARVAVPTIDGKGVEVIPVPKALRDASSVEPFYNLPALPKGALAEPKPEGFNYPVTITANPHLHTFSRPHESWDENIGRGMVRVKTGTNFNEDITDAVAQGIDYAHEVGANPRVTTFRAKDPFTLARTTNEFTKLPVRPSEAGFSDLWMPNPARAAQTDINKKLLHEKYSPASEAAKQIIKEKLSEAGWKSKATLNKVTSPIEFDEKGNPIRISAPDGGFAEKQEDGRWVVTHANGDIAATTPSGGPIKSGKIAGRMLGDTGSDVWLWPETKHIGDKVISKVDNKTGDITYCDAMGKGCTVCKGCATSNTSSPANFILGATDEPYCEAGCPQCFVGHGQSGTSGRKSIQFNVNAKQQGYGEGDLGEEFAGFSDALNRAIGQVNTPREIVDTATHSFKSPQDMEQAAVNLHGVQRFSLEDLAQSLAEIGKHGFGVERPGWAEGGEVNARDALLEAVRKKANSEEGISDEEMSNFQEAQQAAKDLSVPSPARAPQKPITALPPSVLKLSAKQLEEEQARDYLRVLASQANSPSMTETQATKAGIPLEAAFGAPAAALLPLLRGVAVSPIAAIEGLMAPGKLTYQGARELMGNAGKPPEMFPMTEALAKWLSDKGLNSKDPSVDATAELLGLANPRAAAAPLRAMMGKARDAYHYAMAPVYQPEAQALMTAPRTQGALSMAKQERLTAPPKDKVYPAGMNPAARQQIGKQLSAALDKASPRTYQEQMADIAAVIRSMDTPTLNKIKPRSQFTSLSPFGDIFNEGNIPQHPMRNGGRCG